MPNKKEQAMHMYLNESCTQQHIATTLGISVRTIYSWIRQNSWDRLKQASLAAPVIIADNMCSQLLAMQQAIAAREPGQQFPTMQEAEITRKLVMCIDKLKRYPSITQSMQVLETFRQYVKAGNERDSWPIERWMGNFMASKAKGGFRPNDIEYNAEKLSPFGLPFEEEEDINDTATTQDDSIDDLAYINPTESTSENFSDQPEIQVETDTHATENQLNNVSVSLVERHPDRQQSEVNQPNRHQVLPDKIPANFNIEELVDNLTAENFKGEHVSPETVAAYRQSLMLVMQGNLLDYEIEAQPEISPQNTSLPIENQRSIHASDGT